MTSEWHPLKRRLLPSPEHDDAGGLGQRRHFGGPGENLPTARIFQRAAKAFGVGSKVVEGEQIAFPITVNDDHGEPILIEVDYARVLPIELPTMKIDVDLAARNVVTSDRKIGSKGYGDRFCTKEE